MERESEKSSAVREHERACDFERIRQRHGGGATPSTGKTARRELARQRDDAH